MRRICREAGAAVVGAMVFAASGYSIGSTTDLAVPGRTNAEPSVAAQGSFVVVSWAAAAPGGATDVYAAVSRDAGRTFGGPQRVNDATGAANVSGEQPPRVALVRRDAHDPSIVIVWTAKGAAGTRLLSARSENGGVSFARATEVPGSAAAGNRGWETTTTDGNGRVFALWLDHRELAEKPPAAAPMQHEGHAHTGHGDADAAARAQSSKLYFAGLDDSRAQAITGGVCYCCKTGLAAGPDGSIYAAWRHVYPGNIRDIAFTVSRDHGRTFAPPARVSEDKWVLDGCPENGPAIAVDSRNTVHVVWPTLVTGKAAGSEPNLALFYASSRDGREFTPRQQIPTEGTPRHPQVAIGSDGSLLVAWDEQVNGTRRLVVSQGAANDRGVVAFTRLPSDASARSEYPAVATASGGFVIAWTSGQAAQSVIRVGRAGF